MARNRQLNPGQGLDGPDIREKPTIGHADVVQLNFIRNDGPYVFRRHFRNGLRSHVMEVLAAEDVRRETAGVRVEGILRFPRARPLKMLRLFRRRFTGPEEVFQEVERVKLVEQYLTAQHMARSNEFIAEYRSAGRKDIFLCGLQEFVEGERLDPWSPTGLRAVPGAGAGAGAGAAETPPPDTDARRRTIQRRVRGFVQGVKAMIRDTGYVPDLAGAGNLLLTPGGNVKLVDINNISAVTFSPGICLDDIGYPACDKSIEALSLLERNYLNCEPDLREPVYRHHLDPDRLREVQALDRAFHRRINDRRLTRNGW